MSDDCLFCKIVAGDIPATVVRDDERTLAFRDVNPQAPVHVLVVPKRHLPDAAAVLADDPTLLSAMFASAVKVTEDEKLGDGYRLVFNTGKGAGQTVFHAHLHLLGGRDLGWPPG
ncbi:histidine triad nucleotide-binding protein [Fodinicola acaciae]|uniref:histidine triad nucleotide-binding protein n=1 Tax=Fodinicola acaciae TaxID=2681555 RepID=UPI0013D017FD|nr:histidine triad nucleotide-binding protein [Fodinicola acaciae]